MITVIPHNGAADAHRARMMSRRIAQCDRRSDVLEMTQDQKRRFVDMFRRNMRKLPKNPIRVIPRIASANGHTHTRENERRRLRLAK